MDRRVVVDNTGKRVALFKPSEPGSLIYRPLSPSPQGYLLFKTLRGAWVEQSPGGEEPLFMEINATEACLWLISYGYEDAAAITQVDDSTLQI